MAKRFPKVDEALHSPTPTAVPEVPVEENPLVEKISKMDAVRKVLAEGLRSPQEIAQALQERYQLEISPNQVSNYKSLIKKGETPTNPAPRVSKSPLGVEDFLDLMDQVTTLAKKYGKETIQKMLEKLP